nr:MAG TPA: hypothetical protein [Caudoviricetes sp.]
MQTYFGTFVLSTFTPLLFSTLVLLYIGTR